MDHQYGEVWNGVNYGTNTPQRDYPKAWQWKSAYHDFEHVLVGYITGQWLNGQPATLHYAFTKSVDQSAIHPYYFSAAIDSLTTTTDTAGNAYQAVVFHPPAAASPGPAVTAVSGASYLDVPLAAGSMAALFGSGLSGGTVTLGDSSGASLAASVLFSSASQINFVVPAAAKPGPATITISVAASAAIANVQVAAVSPGIFQLNLATGLAAVNVVRVKAEGQQSTEADYTVDAANNAVASPIDLGPVTDQVYLSIYGTGFQNAQSVSATVGGQSVAVGYFGPQGGAPGLDQVNVGPLPRVLAGRGRVNIVLVADGQTANPVQVVIK